MRSGDLVTYFNMARDGFNILRELFPRRQRSPEPPPTPPDFTEKTRQLRAKIMAPRRAQSPVQAPVLEKPTPTSPQGTLTRSGVDEERMRWQDALIRGELWLLEGHLKNKCLGCGGDVECCFKHTTNLGDATRETMSMTTDPLYRETVDLADRILPLVHPEDVKAGTYQDRYPALVIEVSQLRTLFDNRVMKRKPTLETLEQAKKLAAEVAMSEVERRWSQAGGNTEPVGSPDETDYSTDSGDKDREAA